MVPNQSDGMSLHVILLANAASPDREKFERVAARLGAEYEEAPPGPCGPGVDKGNHVFNTFGDLAATSSSTSTSSPTYTHG